MLQGDVTSVVICVSVTGRWVGGRNGCVRKKGINTTDNKDVKTASIIWDMRGMRDRKERRERVDGSISESGTNKRWITKKQRAQK